jgi:4-amino-4-deoxy-L-arabinose transferase-like glycosyltransferase
MADGEPPATDGEGRHFPAGGRWRHVPLIGAVAVGFLLRFGWLLLSKPFPVSDYNDYRTLALGIIDHGQFGYPEPTAFFLPVHPTFLAGFALISRSDFWLSFSMVLVAGFSTFLVYLVAIKALPSRRAALIATWGFAVFPTFVAFSPVLATEHLFIALMLTVMAFLVRVDDAPARNLVLAGLATGLAILTRGEAVFYLPALVLWLWFGRTGITWPQRLRSALLMGAAVLVVVAPWYLRNSVVVGPEAGLSASAGINFYFAHNDSGNYGDFIEGSEIHGLASEEASTLGWKLGWQHIRAHPLNLIRDIRVGTFQLFGPPAYATIWPTQGADFHGDPDFYTRDVRLMTVLRDMARAATPAVITLAGLSVLAARSWRREYTWLLVPLVISSWGLRTVIYWGMPRYAYFITVLFVIASGMTIDLMLRGAESMRRTARPGGR